MDLVSESSAIEYVEDNGLIQQVDHLADDGRFHNNGSCSVEMGKPVSAPTAEAHQNEKAVERDKLLNSDSSGAKLPADASRPTKKGYGLKKWRRIKRDHVKDTSANVENSKILKRVFTGSANVHSKHMHLPSLEIRRDSQCSIGSMNLQKNISATDCSTVPGSSPDHRSATEVAFSAGMDSESSEDRSSRSSTAASVPKVRHGLRMGHSCDKQWMGHFGARSIGHSGQRGQRGKNRVENIKKPREARVKIEKENSHSSMESDSRNSNFVFVQGDHCSGNRRKQSGRVMDYNSEDSDEAYANGETSQGKDNVEDEVEDLSQDSAAEKSTNGNLRASADKDPLTESINGILTIEEALGKELQKFRETGKEYVPLRYDADNSICIQAASLSTGQCASEPNSSHQLEAERVGQKGLTSLDSHILALVTQVEFLESKLEEARAMVEVKEIRIRELESTVDLNKTSEGETGSTSESPHEMYGGKEIGLDAAFQQKIEAEIEHLILSRSIENLRAVLNDQMKMFEAQKTLAGEEAHQMLSKLGEAQSKAAALKKKAEELENRSEVIIETQEVENTRKKACKTTSYFMIQLLLLLLLVWLLISQLLPQSDIVVPT